MKYFTELLESYDKLKKRTFKINTSLLNEQDVLKFPDERIQDCIQELELELTDILENTKLFPMGDLDTNFLYNLPQKAMATQVISVQNGVKSLTPIDQEDVCIALETLLGVLKRCRRFFSNSFLEEDAAWIDAHVDRDQYGIWFKNPYLLPWGLSFSFREAPEYAFFQVLCDSYNKYYSNWCIDRNIDPTYFIDEIEERTPNHSGKAGLLDSLEAGLSNNLNKYLQLLYLEQYDQAIAFLEGQANSLNISLDLFKEIKETYFTGTSLGTECTAEICHLLSKLDKITKFPVDHPKFGIGILKAILKRQVKPETFEEGYDKVVCLDPKYIVIGCENLVDLFDRFMEGDFNHVLEPLGLKLKDFEALEKSIDLVNRGLDRVSLATGDELESRRQLIDYLDKTFSSKKNYYELISQGSIRDIDLNNDQYVEKLKKYLFRLVIASKLAEADKDQISRKILGAFVLALSTKENPLTCFNITQSREHFSLNMGEFIKDIVTKFLVNEVQYERIDPDTFCLKKHNDDLVYLDFKDDKVILSTDRETLLTDTKELDYNSLVNTYLDNQRVLLEKLYLKK